MRSSEWAIDLTHVDKMYRGKIHALRGIDMRVRRGEVFGLLGPNGAGKSTLVKILMTVISPTRAEGMVLDTPVGHKPTLARLGYLPEHHRFPEYLTGGQVVDFYGAMAGVPGEDRRRRAPELLELVGMKEWANTRVKQYSKGMRQRIGIAQALINDPDLVVLDEPTDGVDPVGRRDIRGMVQRLKEKGKTVFLNSHLLSELEMVCDRVAILVQGKVSSQGTIRDLTRDSLRYVIMVRGDAPAWTSEYGLRAATGAPGTTMLVQPSDDAEAIQNVIDRLRSEARVIVSVTPVRESLEDLFMRAVTDPTTGRAAAPGAALEGRAR
ncbi:putative ABC transporter ATP-binding protein YxlF [Phycisphaerales bacterium]|nr:putative ABC transporter ATP-binding protein YxlF [Phycisphaerales bacterium]